MNFEQEVMRSGISSQFLMIDKNKYKVILKNKNGKSFFTEYTSNDIPNKIDVLKSLLENTLVDNYLDFYDYAEELGVDKNTKEKYVFTEARKQSEYIKKFLGDNFEILITRLNQDNNSI